MKIEPFTSVPMYVFNVEPDIKKYWDIFNSLIDSEHIKIGSEDGIIGDYFSNHSEWDHYINDNLKDCFNFLLKDTNKSTYNWESQYEETSTLWTQITKKWVKHGIHDHSESSNNGTLWSFVWYIKVEKEAGHRGTVFYNPLNMSDKFEAEPKTGNLYFWPSNLLHEQSASNSEDMRIIISGNLKIS